MNVITNIIKKTPIKHIQDENSQHFEIAKILLVTFKYIAF